MYVQYVCVVMFMEGSEETGSPNRQQNEAKC